MRHAALTCVALLGALAGCDSPTRIPDTLPLGEWGGQSISVTVTPSDVFFGFDCAGGHVAGPLRLDPSGAFDVTGTFTGAGNAFGADNTPHPARYFGHADAKTITVTVTRLDTTFAGVPMPLTATLGAPRFVVAC